MNETQAAETEKMYENFLSSISKRQWQKIGIKKRSGVCAPLFSLYSRNSIGIGEIPDLKLLVDWCVKTRMSIIQLLPMNDVGFDFRPYDAQSTFALEPMCLCLEALRGVDVKEFKTPLKDLRKRFPCGGRYVNYEIKREKMALLWDIFCTQKGTFPEEFARYREAQHFWLEDYLLFKVIKEKVSWDSWENWPANLRKRHAKALAGIRSEHAASLDFHAWLQWQLFEQFREMKTYAFERGVYLMGDLPFLVSRDSADVWAHQDYFKMDRLSGAPPDAYIAEGQRWGMPPYNWKNIAAHRYDYLIEKVRYAENFYDMFRIDHVVGVFRIWTLAADEPPEHGGRVGHFDPQDEGLWEDQGRRLLGIMVENTQMLPCAEDLGTVPDCSYRVLADFAIPGMDIQRWTRDWHGDGSFVKPEAYRKNSIAVISTHDMPVFLAWWRYELASVEESKVREFCGREGLDAEEVFRKLFLPPVNGRAPWRPEVRDCGQLPEMLGLETERCRGLMDLCREGLSEKEKFLDYLGLKNAENPSEKRIVEKALEKVSESSSIFSVQLLQDWLSLEGFFSDDPWEARINFPGSLNEKNWALVMPLSLEQMDKLEINPAIHRLNQGAGRV